MEETLTPDPNCNRPVKDLVYKDLLRHQNFWCLRNREKGGLHTKQSHSPRTRLIRSTRLHDDESPCECCADGDQGLSPPRDGPHR